MDLPPWSGDCWFSGIVAAFPFSESTDRDFDGSGEPMVHGLLSIDIAKSRVMTLESENFRGRGNGSLEV